MKVLFIGDIVGKLGRKAVTALMSDMRKEYKPDFVIANVENLAHGHGVTISTLQEMVDAGIDCFTSGNHIWRNPDVSSIFAEKSFPLVRPANYSAKNPGCGYQSFNISQKKIIVLNLQGRVSMRDLVDNPFEVFDNIIEEIKSKKPDHIILDFHAETTSEKQAFGYYVDGLVSAIVGTHTHIQTADERILEKGTAYIADVGMVGGNNTVLGVETEGIIKTYRTGVPVRHEYPDKGIAKFNAVLLDLGENNSAKSIKRVNKIININN